VDLQRNRTEFRGVRRHCDRPAVLPRCSITRNVHLRPPCLMLQRRCGQAQRQRQNTSRGCSEAWPDKGRQDVFKRHRRGHTPSELVKIMNVVKQSYNVHKAC